MGHHLLIPFCSVLTITFAAAGCGSDKLVGASQHEEGTEQTECPPDSACDDGDPCTFDDVCREGSCFGEPYECEDNNSCTEASCDGLGGCFFVPNALECDDGDPCTADDSCTDGECRGELYDCDDGDPCTVDSCNGDGTCEQEDSGCSGELPPETIVWTGYYDCPLMQGITALDLTTTRDAQTNQINAIFAFSEHPDNPGIPSGSWNMEGDYFPEDNSMLLLPTGWIVQPDGWVMVGMEGWYDGPQQQIHGNILLANGLPNPFCNTFDLERVP